MYVGRKEEERWDFGAVVVVELVVDMMAVVVVEVAASREVGCAHVVPVPTYICSCPLGENDCGHPSSISIQNENSGSNAR